ncbi:hypothetical protein HBB16_17600 [Pseudonocardia sp. MCCB 268]|nr:hypothetical protein [Pseudonocardia cytotoxica]
MLTPRQGDGRRGYAERAQPARVLVDPPLQAAPSSGPRLLLRTIASKATQAST